MPFGVMNAESPSWIGCGNDFVSVYLNDFITFPESLEDHENGIQSVKRCKFKA